MAPFYKLIKATLTVFVIGTLFTVGPVQANDFRCRCYNDEGGTSPNQAVTQKCCNGLGTYSGDLCTLEENLNVLRDDSFLLRMFELIAKASQLLAAAILAPVTLVIVFDLTVYAYRQASSYLLGGKKTVKQIEH
ncbi:hypothetical protein BDA99DRAFT_603440 [Phascolomyces articulosus]|uniref:EGF-like domain-containing protein n=1 Tax=Phascolomyces articulosus TaxID=60185 RepID=A0AAD5K543_9FUNG|nr:hypothetical protein BDA99DRAFT_603440 [Phascolomyces articulosus]